MTQDHPAPTLDDVAGGDCTSAQARRLFAELLRDPGGTVTTAVYHALRGWTWKALDEKRRDGDLRGWHDVLKRVAAHASRTDPETASKIEVLGELVYESIAVSTRSTPEEILQRRAARAILKVLSGAPDREIGFEVLSERLDFRKANLSMVLRAMYAVGLAERIHRGGSIVVRLGREGEAALAPSIGRDRSSDGLDLPES